MRLWFLVLSLPLGSALSGCLGERIDTAQAGAPAVHIEVVESGSEYRFQPTTISLARGTAVMLMVHNNGTVPHAFVNHDFHLHSGRLAPGVSGTIPFTPTTAGRFGVVCDEPGHAAGGMSATIEVV